MPIKAELLEEIGLTKAEIKVYLALLELGSSTTGAIVDKSGASSSKIYEILDKLMQKGLASYIIKSGVKYFEAAEPKRILDYLEEKRQKLVEQTSQVKGFLPELELKQMLSKYKSEATIYKGMKGLETAFQDLLKTLHKGDTNYVYVVGELDERMNEFFKRQYTLRAKQGIKTKTIFSEAGRKYYESRKNIPLFEGKVVGTTTSPATVNIYGTKVNLRMGTSEHALCIVIDSKELADSFLEQFNLLWNQDITVAKGMDAVIQALKGFVDEIKPGDTFDALGAAFGVKGSEQKFAEEFGKYHQYRLAKGVKARWLFQQGFSHIIEKHRQNYRLGEIKFLPYRAESPVSIHPHQNKTLLIIQEKEPSVITINNKEVTESFHRQFELLWNQKVATFEGEDAVKMVYDSILETAQPRDEVIIFAAKPNDSNQAEFNLRWNKALHTKVKRHRLLYYGDTPTNRKRVHEMNTIGCEAAIFATDQNLPISTIIMGDVVLNSVWGNTPITFKIENQTVADSYRHNFELQWKQGKKIINEKIKN